MAQIFCALRSSSDGSTFESRLDKITSVIEYERDGLLTDVGKVILRDRYMTSEDYSPQELFARVAAAFSDNVEHGLRIYEYISKLWFTPATPLLSNGGTARGLPISCFLSYVDDSRQGLADHYTENIWLTTSGGGIGGHWSDVRSKGQRTSLDSETSGIIPFLKVADAQIPAFNQGVTRRGAYASYLHISHPEIQEYIQIRKTTGGDINRKCVNSHHGVVIPDEFMEAVKYDTDWQLIDPKTKEVVKEVKARYLWQLILETRMETGEPYLYFEDSCHDWYESRYIYQPGTALRGSNLCTEIILPTGQDYTAVCCLSSLNISKYDEYQHCFEEVVEDLVRFLDNALEVFLENEHPGIESACNSIRWERSIGIGAMGLHHYYQKQGWCFDSPAASSFNVNFFGRLSGAAYAASEKLGIERGVSPGAENIRTRNAKLLAIAPNATSSLIAGTSPSIEPWRANAFSQKTLSGTHLIKNPVLEELFREQYTEEEEEKLWRQIVQNKGSIKGILPGNLGDLYKTAEEIDQTVLIDQASDRQEFIDQAQSLNLFVPADISKRDLHHLHFRAWAKYLKTLYYLRSSAINRAETVSVENVRTEPAPASCGLTPETCTSCEG